jgi:putative ATP-dependent endonuclease of the OLD family
MVIEKIVIQNYKCFEKFEFVFNSDLNIFVGDNEVGKSTILEAVHLCFSGYLHGRSIVQEVSPFLFNSNVSRAYIAGIKAGQNAVPPPKILIELWLKANSEIGHLRGSINSKRVDGHGISLAIEFDEDYKEEYQTFLKEKDSITAVPAEYYRVKWHSFSDNLITKRSLPVNSILIDTATIRLQYGTDYYIQNVLSNNLTVKERAQLTLAYRKLKENFALQEPIKSINTNLRTDKSISDRDFSLSIDVSQRSGWEANLTTYLDDIPFQFIGKGEQNVFKTLLALQRKADDSHIILIEEPENHLSFSTMNKLVKKITEKCVGKQVLITTHSAFVLNKLGMEKVVLLHKDGRTLTLSDLSPETELYFKKLPGYDTLRLLLAKKSILVEGPSDELFLQKIYLNKHGRLPIDDGIDVMSVRGLSFKRFLEIAKILGNEVMVITDNDGNYKTKVIDKYKDFAATPTIKVVYDTDDSCNTLELQLAKVNALETLNSIFGSSYSTKAEVVEYMIKNKTDWAIKLFETEITFVIPKYIDDAVQ